MTIKVEGLSVNYGKSCALFDISFQLKSGTIAAVVGPNGAGKSTLLKAMVGLVKPTAGYAYFFDAPFAKAGGRVSYMPQRTSVDWDFPITTFDVVLMGRYRELGMLKWVRRSDKEAALSKLNLLGMAEYKDRQISELSGGQQQRLFLARALMQEADVYLFDEPFAGIDLTTEKLLVDIMQKLSREGKTLMVVHHDLASVPTYFDEVLLLSTSLVAAGPIEVVFNQENIQRTYGQCSALFTEAAQRSQLKATGRE